MNKTIKRIIYVIIILVIIGAIVYPKLPESTSEETSAASAARSQKLTVEAVVLDKEKLQNQVNLTGTILADESVSVNSEVAGKVERIYFREGQQVSKGTQLIKLNDDEVVAELEKLQFTKKLNEEIENRQKQLLEKEAISQEEYETALTTVNTTNAEIKVLEARLQKHNIRAPFSGKIGLRNISEGSYLNPGSPIAVLYKINPIKLEFSVPSRYLGLVDVGDEINFTVDAFDEEFSGEIYAIEPQIDPQTRSIKIRAKAENKEGKLLPGQFARINLILETIPEALLIPTQAVIPEMNGKKVYLYQNGSVASQSIETGIRTENTVQVTSGLSEGDTVITTGILQINQGSQVNVNIN